MAFINLFMRSGVLLHYVLGIGINIGDINRLMV
jgi:hypothetical protein